MQKKWAFFSYAHNMGDFTRAFEVAKAIKTSGDEVSFFNHGGNHLDWLSKHNIAFYNLKPEISSAENEKVMATFPNTIEKNFFMRYLLPGIIKRKFSIP